MRKHLPDAVVYLVSDIAAESTATFAKDWPSAEKDPELSLLVVKAGLYLHAHGFIAIRGISREKLRLILKGFFKGSRRVTIEDVKPEFTDEKGRLKGGILGFIEYAAMEKTSLNLQSDDPDYDNVAMCEAILLARKVWGRNARKIKINHTGCNASDDHDDYVIRVDQEKDASIPSKVLLHIVLGSFDVKVSPYKWSAVENTPKGLSLLAVSNIAKVSFFGKSMVFQLSEPIRLSRIRGLAGSSSGHLLLFRETTLNYAPEWPERLHSTLRMSTRS